MNSRELLAWGTSELSEVLEADEAENDAWWLLSGICEIRREDLLLRGELEVAAQNETSYRKAIDRRKQHEPTAYILGEWEFMGLPFRTNSAVLIPRQDTETLVEEALQAAEKKLKNNERLRVLDVCTGSGCIAISMAVFLKDKYPNKQIEIMATDLSEKALAVAKENAGLNHVSVEFCQGDMLQPLDRDRKFDLILSNPPYIDAEQMQTLMPEVKEHEPWMALAGGEDGLVFYRRLAEECPDYLEPEGKVFWEIGDEQKESLRSILGGSRLEYVRCIRDLAGKDRVIEAMMGKE